MNHSSKRSNRRRKSRRGKGPRTRPNVDVLSSLFDNMKVEEKKIIKKPADDMSRLENLFSRLKTTTKNPRKSKSSSTKKSRRLARMSRKSDKMEM